MVERRDQRRLTVILASDIVGYSRLMETDESGTLAQLKTLRKEVFDPKLAEYGGRLVKTTGDGALAEFASAVDAVEHALDVQRVLARRNADVPSGHRIELRIGINVGDVIVDGDDIYGDGVNVAARLEALAEPGTVYVSRDVQRQVEGKIQAGFDDLGEPPLKNLERPVRVYRVRIATPEGIGQVKDEPLALPDKPSIAVLPFENMSGDPEQEYFSDGITEDIITDLSKNAGLFVIARNSSFLYKGKTTRVEDVARELGVRHVLEGSVRKAGNRVRINAQLIDATTGGHDWAERYDGDLEDIFGLQDQITANIVSALEVTLSGARRARTASPPTSDMAAYDLFLRGRAAMFPASKEGSAIAREMLENVVDMDPDFAEAYACLGFVYMLTWVFAWADEPGIDEALETAQKAVTLDDSLAPDIVSTNTC